MSAFIAHYQQQAVVFAKQIDGVGDLYECLGERFVTSSRYNSSPDVLAKACMY